MNKKASFILTGELMLWIPRLFLLIISLFAVTWILGTYVSRSPNTSDIEFYILSNRLFYSKNCFSYGGKSIIDVSRFNQDILENCINFGENIALKLTLDYDGKKIELINNEDLFKRGFYAKDIKSKYDYKPEKGYTLIFDENKFYPGWLNIEAVFKNE